MDIAFWISCLLPTTISRLNGHFTPVSRDLIASFFWATQTSNREAACVEICFIYGGDLGSLSPGILTLGLKKGGHACQGGNRYRGDTCSSLDHSSQKFGGRITLDIWKNGLARPHVFKTVQKQTLFITRQRFEVPSRPRPQAFSTEHIHSLSRSVLIYIKIYIELEAL